MAHFTRIVSRGPQANQAYLASQLFDLVERFPLDRFQQQRGGCQADDTAFALKTDSSEAALVVEVRLNAHFIPTQRVEVTDFQCGWSSVPQCEGFSYGPGYYPDTFQNSSAS